MLFTKLTYAPFPVYPCTGRVPPCWLSVRIRFISSDNKHLRLRVLHSLPYSVPCSLDYAFTAVYSLVTCSLCIYRTEIKYPVVFHVPSSLFFIYSSSRVVAVVVILQIAL